MRANWSQSESVRSHVETKATKLKTSLDSGVLREYCLKEETAQLKAAQREEVWDAIRRGLSDQSVRGKVF